MSVIRPETKEEKAQEVVRIFREALADARRVLIGMPYIGLGKVTRKLVNGIQEGLNIFEDGLMAHLAGSGKKGGRDSPGRGIPPPRQTQITYPFHSILQAKAGGPLASSPAFFR